MNFGEKTCARVLRSDMYEHNASKARKLAGGLQAYSQATAETRDACCEMWSKQRSGSLVR